MVLRALKSVIKQTHKNTEIIIVDDSPDNFSERINVEKSIKSINDKRIMYIKHDQNYGGCAARNTG